MSDQKRASIYAYQPLFGSWNIDEEIGEGSFGIVYRVSKEEMGEKYESAVKLITIPTKEQYREAEVSIGTDERTLSTYFEDIIKNIVREVRVLHTLSGNTNIVGYLDHAVKKHEDDLGWDILIRMEYVTSLRKYLKDHRLTREQVVCLGIDICTAIELCSKKGIIHRDIKDDNIFINEDGAFKLGDFGIARELSKSGRAASMRGTPLYMAPEIYRGDKYDAAVDIYSLGIVLYKLLNNGRMPFMPPWPEEVRYKDSEQALEKRLSGEALPPPSMAHNALASVVLKACAYQPEDRFISAALLKRELERTLSEMSEEMRAEFVTQPLAAKAGMSIVESGQLGRTESIFSTGNQDANAEASVGEDTAKKPKLDNTTSMFATEEISTSKGSEIKPRLVSVGEKETEIVRTEETLGEKTEENIDPVPYILESSNTRVKRKLVYTAVAAVIILVLGSAGAFALFGNQGKENSDPIALQSSNSETVTLQTDSPGFETVEAPVTANEESNAVAAHIAEIAATTATSEETQQPLVQTSNVTKEPTSTNAPKVVRTKTPEVKVPSLVGLTKSEAQSKLSKLGIKYVISKASSETYNSNYVISQKPTAGTSIESGSQVTIVISTGGAWSSWATAVPSGVDSSRYEIQNKTQYQYCDKEFKQSGSATMDGYTLYDQKVTDWTAFSAWSTTVYTASDTRKVNTRAINRTQWQYGRYLWKDANGNWCSTANPKSGVSNEFQLSGWFDSQWAYSATYGDGSKAWRHPSTGNLWYTNPNRSNYGSPTREVLDHNEYQYSDAIFTYYFYRWGSWSSWSDNQVTKTADKDVKTRTVYQWRLK